MDCKMDFQQAHAGQSMLWLVSASEPISHSDLTGGPTTDDSNAGEGSSDVPTPIIP
jgi:hypothetical protein